MASLNSNVFGRSQEQSIAGMASLNRRVFGRHQDPLLLAGAKNTQTVAGMASSHNSVFFMQGPRSGPSWHGQSQQQRLWQEPRTIHS